MVAELDANCEGCQAAARALQGWKHVVAKAIAKAKEQAAEIERLKEQIESLHEAAAGEDL